MENYILREDETVLFKSRVQMQITSKKKIEVELLLTNLNFVFIRDKKFFSKSIENEVFDVKNVKIYDATYQIVRKNKKVEIYMIGVEKFLEFPTLKSAKEFTDIALKLVSGYSKFVRGIKKAQKSVKETEDALDIDIKETTKKAVAFAGEVAVVMGENSKSPKMKFFGNVAKSIKEVSGRNKNKSNEIDNKEQLMLSHNPDEKE